jgi:hypothetical protein
MSRQRCQQQPRTTFPCGGVGGGLNCVFLQCVRLVTTVTILMIATPITLLIQAGSGAANEKGSGRLVERLGEWAVKGPFLLFF